MSLSSKLSELKKGFHKSFWVANIMELFERLAFYGQNAILSIFLRDHLELGVIKAGQLTSIFGGLIYFLPIFAGALADKLGYRKSFSIAFLGLAIGYFLVGSTGIVGLEAIYKNMDLFPVLVTFLVFTAIGGSFIKPSVLGTVALTTTDKTKAIGYAIYYWLVNIGGALGPLFAYLVRDSLGIEFVYLTSSISCLLMFISTLVFYKEPDTTINRSSISLLVLLKNLKTVTINLKFMAFLLIFSLYWLMFWQIFIIIPFYITDYISADAPFEIIISAGSWSIIAFQLIINFLTKEIKPINAIIIGFVLSSISWLIMIIHPNLLTITAGIICFSIGEQVQAPRYYEYIANLAPKGQEALYQGFAFLPISIGYFFGGTIGGILYNEFGFKGSNNPLFIFEILLAVGIFATFLMILYNYFVQRLNKT